MGAVIGGLFGFLFFCLWIGLFVFTIYTWVTYYGSKKNEMRAYENMIGFPSDNSVTGYIHAFEKSYNYAARLVNGVYAGKSMEDKMRQAGGYKIIMFEKTSNTEKIFTINIDISLKYDIIIS